MLIVADTSALLALAACDGLNLLDALFHEIRVPVAVFDECVVPGKSYAGHLREYLANKVATVDHDEFVIAAGGLGKGELQAMMLYKQMHADRLLMDDGRARRVATANHIHVVGSIGTLLLAKAHGLIPSVKSKLNAIQSAGIHMSEPLLQEALRLAGEA